MNFGFLKVNKTPDCFVELYQKMGEEVRMSVYDSGVGDGGDEERVHEWEVGLPSASDLAPLSQPLIPPELASAFSISPEPSRSMVDVNRASKNTLSSLRGQTQAFSSNNYGSLPSFKEDKGREGDQDPLVVEADETDQGRDGSDSRKIRRLDSVEEADSALRMENSNDDQSRTGKRPRLVWTAQLHKRFVEVVAHLGIKNAVPKTIMQLMNVEGLTRENVASHLQKYRLYLKRMQGLPSEDPASSDPLFASTPVPQSQNETGANGNGHGQMPMPIPMPYPPSFMHMPVYGVGHDPSHMRIPPSHPYNMTQQHRDWSANTFSSSMTYPHGAPNDR